MTRFRTNPQAIDETIDGETIIIDLSSGTYFSLQGSGPAIWSRLLAGDTVDEIMAIFSLNGDVPAARELVGAFVDKLVTEGLVTPVDDEATAQRTAAAGGVPFEAPKLEKYTDMQDIILLDPVHQVDDRGWPHAAAGA